MGLPCAHAVPAGSGSGFALAGSRGADFDNDEAPHRVVDGDLVEGGQLLFLTALKK